MTQSAKRRTRTRTPSQARSPGSSAAPFFPPVARKAAPEAVQAKLRVSQPADKLEQEADRTADAVLRSAAPAQVTPTQEASSTLHRAGNGGPSITAHAGTAIQQALTGGTALAPEVRSFMEPRFGAEFGDVRVHTDDQAASLSNHLSARAFTYRNHIFFGRGQYRPGSDEGRHLLAHELTHTIQQGGTIRRAPAERSPAAAVSPAGSEVQRLGVGDAIEYLADKAVHIPGFRLLTVAIGINPINGRVVDRTAANLLRALIELIPGGALLTQALDAHGVIGAAASWAEEQFAAFAGLGTALLREVRAFVGSLSWTDIVDPGAVWDRAERLVTAPIGRLLGVVARGATVLLELVKNAVLRPLARLAHGTAGYDVLCAVLGEDPISGEPVARTPDTLIGGFMKLIGQEEVWRNIKQGNAVGRAFAWFQGALAGLLGFVRSVPGRILGVLHELTVADLLTVAGAFRRVVTTIAGVAVEFGTWAANQVLGLLEILFSVVAPGALPYLAKARASFATIVRDPVTFIGHLVRAGRLGFERFAANITGHLKTALITWITGPLGEAGVYVPSSFSLVEILKLVLSVLGLTWQAVRAKLVKIIPEPVLAGLERTAGVLVTLATQGPAAAWEQIRTEVAELKDQLVGQITQMIQGEVVGAAVKKLVSMLNPAGAVVQAIIAIANTVTFFVEKARQIGAVVASFIDSISEISAGRVDTAAAKVEATMARTLNVVLAFLAKFTGLGGIPDKLVGIVKRIRQPVDKALDRIVDWLGRMLAKLVSSAKDAAGKLLAWWKKKVPVGGDEKPHTLLFRGERRSAALVVQSDPRSPVAFLDDAANRGGISEGKRERPITTTKGHVTKITRLQTELGHHDDPSKAAARGASGKAAETAANALDAQMDALGEHLGTTLAKWKVNDPVVEGLAIKRGSFTITQKDDIAKEAKRIDPETKDLRLDSSKELRNVRRGIARRHVVSAYDMGSHYMAVLNGKPVSAAKLLLEQRGSIDKARVTVAGRPTPKAVMQAALERYGNFFGFARNLFLGDSRENSRIQQHLDPDHPEMQGKGQLQAHVDRMKRSWALDDTFTPSEVKPE